MQTVSMRGARSARWILAAPLLVLLIVMMAYPMYLGFRTSLSRDLLSDPMVSFSGIKNYVNLATDPKFWGAIRFTLVFAVVTTSLELVLGFLLALLFDRKVPGKKLLFSAVLVPIMIAPSLMAVMFRLLLNENIGIVPALLEKIGLSISLFSPGSILPLLVVLDCLQFIPFTFLLFYSALQNVPDEMYESASLDGASYRRIVFSIILPLLKPAIVVILLLRFLEAIRNFDVIYILTGGGPGTTTQTIGIYIYKTAFDRGDFGMAAAASVALVLLLAPFTPWIIRRLSASEQQ